MLVTSIMRNPGLMLEVVDKLNAIIRTARECADLSEPAVASDDGFRTFVNTMRCTRITFDENGQPVFSITLPTATSCFWMANVDPFLLSEGLRELSVSLTLAVFDVDNQNGLIIN